MTKVHLGQHFEYIQYNQQDNLLSTPATTYCNIFDTCQLPIPEIKTNMVLQKNGVLYFLNSI